MYLPDDDLVELEACKRNISENLLFIIYCEIRWLQRYMVNLLHGIWMEDGIQRELQVQVSGALSKPKCLCLSFFRMRCDLCRRCWNSSSRLCGVGVGVGGGPISARRTSSFLHYSSEIPWKLIGRDDLTTRPPRSSDRTPPAIFFWRHTVVAAYGPLLCRNCLGEYVLLT